MTLLRVVVFFVIDSDPFVDFCGVGWKEVTWPDTGALLVSFGLTWRSTSNSDKLKESAKSFVTLF